MQPEVARRAEAGGSQARRLIEVTAAVALWIALGLALRLSPNAYLLLGIPLTAAFQLGVRRQPIRALWVRQAPPFRLGLPGWIAAAALATYPAVRLVAAMRSEGLSVNALWFLAAIAGAVPAAYALQHFRRETARHVWFGLATAGVFGIAFVLLSALGNGMSPNTPAGRLHYGVTSLLLYVPVVFLLEEVSFRGAFDSHVFHPGERREYLTAFAVSALWGLWHIPVAQGGKTPVWALIPGLLGVHVAIGYPLSVTWRRSGNLFTVGFVHALIDAVRNALLLG
jgi:Type II CAAX prenyl endopeptidase Rce1-like